jgi:hypothetical protein
LGSLLARHFAWVATLTASTGAGAGGLKQARKQNNRGRALWANVVALLTIGILVSCGQLPGNSGQSRPEAELVDAVDCTTMQHIVEPRTPSPRQPAAGTVPKAFFPVDVIRCDTMMATLEDAKGLWSAVTEERLSGNVDALVDALAQPSDGPRMNQACTADMELVPDLWLLDTGGKAMRAAWPTDSCGKTKAGVRKVLAGMEVIESKQYRVALIEPRAALDAHCPAEWGSEALQGAVGLAPVTRDPDNAAPGVNGGAMPGSPGLLPNAGEVDSLRICQYRNTRTPNAADERPAGTQPESPFDVIEIVSGTFFRGGSLEGAAKDAILQAAAMEGSVAACGEAATDFVGIWPLAQGQSAGAPLTVELDGCRRLVGLDGAARSVPKETIIAIVKSLEK